MTEIVLTHFNRATEQLVDEPVYAGGFLRWSYNTALGWFTTDLIFSRRFVVGATLLVQGLQQALDGRPAGW